MSAQLRHYWRAAFAAHDFEKNAEGVKPAPATSGRRNRPNRPPTLYSFQSSGYNTG
jgi:hypothetical protein